MNAPTHLFSSTNAIPSDAIHFCVSIQCNGLHGGDSALIGASKKGNTETAIQLISAGAKLDLQNQVCIHTHTHAHTHTHTHTHFHVHTNTRTHTRTHKHHITIYLLLANTYTHCCGTPACYKPPTSEPCCLLPAVGVDSTDSCKF